MSRSYRNIRQYEKEIYKLREKGLSLREIGEQLGFTREQVRGLIKRNNRKQRMIASGEAIHRKGRSFKDQEGSLPPSIQRLDKLSQMRYVMASKDRYIKRLEMENELMRDFLSLTERK